MLLDNLFSMIGGFTTSVLLLGVVCLVGWAPVSALVCPKGLMITGGRPRV
jgi:hypothetical protein